MLTQNFSWKEFECRDGTPVPLAYQGNVRDLATQLQTLRELIRRPIHIRSAYRTPDHNEYVGGAKNSQHLYGKAADFHVANWSGAQLAGYVEALIDLGFMYGPAGIGIYDDWIHYDTRDERARWTG